MTAGAAEPGEGEALPFAAPVSIPLTELGGPGSSRVQLEFFGGILRRLQDAAAEGDAALIDSLVESYDLPNVPESFRRHLVGYRAIARGILFQQHVQQHPTRDQRMTSTAPAPADAATKTVTVTIDGQTGTGHYGNVARVNEDGTTTTIWSLVSNHPASGM